jgi:putative DNA primase/helicase
MSVNGTFRPSWPIPNLTVIGGRADIGYRKLFVERRPPGVSTKRTDCGVGTAMPTLGNFFKQYLPIRFGSGPSTVIAGVDGVAPNQTFQPVGLQDFLALQVPPREMLLAPILPERSLAMLYAPRGMGKSLIALTMGLAVASGSSVLRWNAPKPRGVLLVDGEMLLADLQTRLNLILAGLGTKIPDDGFRVLAADHTERGINLSTGEGQQELERQLDGIDLLILDNLSTLLANGSEGASDAWLPMQNWLLRLRRKGVAVLLIHHAGVNGRQRGTSRREDALDTVIALRRPGDYSPEQGARFEVHLEKARSLVGDGAAPFEAAVEPFTTEIGEAAVRWTARDLKPSVYQQATLLFQDGRTIRQVKTLLGISHGEAGRLRLRAAAEGLLNAGPGDEQAESEVAPDGPFTLN